MITHSNFWRFVSSLAMLVLMSKGVLAEQSLVLRVQDTTARPGGQAQVVMRTYQTRPVGQGTICFFLRDQNGAPPPIETIRRVEIFSQAEDVIESINITESGDTLVLDVSFSSTSASINTVDGPMAAIFLDVSPQAVPGSQLSISIEPAQSFLLDENGQNIPLEIRSGDFSVVDASQPFEISAESEPPESPGQPVSLLFETEEAFEIATGQVALRYSSRELPGEPEILLDPRYGFAKIKLDGYPGLAILKIVSSDTDFNQLPGGIVRVNLMPAMAYDGDNRTHVRIDPALTFLYDKRGNVIPLVIHNPAPIRLTQ